MVDYGEQRHGRKCGERYRQIDFYQDLNRARAVDPRRLVQRFRHTLEEVDQQDDIEHGNGTREHQRPDRIGQMQIADYHEQRNDAAGKQHCKNDEFNVDLARRKAFPALGERIRHAHCEEHVDEQSQDHPLHRDQERFPELCVLQQFLVGDERKILRDKAHLVRGNRIAPAEGDRKHIDQRKQAAQREDHHDRPHDHHGDNSFAI